MPQPREERTVPRPIESIDPALLLSAYAQGIFPMADGADDPSVHWVEPRLRGATFYAQWLVFGQDAVGPYGVTTRALAVTIQ